MNFILVHFKTEYSLPRLTEYYKDVGLYHELMIKQIDSLYENYEIHVITNVKEESTDKVIYHYFPDLIQSNYAKLMIYGLLDKPAMYLDNDIILVRKFEEKHLPMDNAFNMYQEFDMPLPKGFPSYMFDYPHYNSGIVWVAKPDKEITEALFSVKDRFVVHEAGWAVDEYPLNFFIHAFGMKMHLFPEVDAYRKSTKIPLKECQSIHYAGVKELFLSELKLFNSSLTIPNN